MSMNGVWVYGYGEEDLCGSLTPFSFLDDLSTPLDVKR